MKLKFDVGIREKLLAIVISIVTVLCLSLTLINYESSKGVLESSTLNLMRTITKESANLVDAEIEKVFTMGE